MIGKTIVQYDPKRRIAKAAVAITAALHTHGSYGPLDEEQIEALYEEDQGLALLDDLEARVLGYSLPEVRAALVDAYRYQSDIDFVRSEFRSYPLDAVPDMGPFRCIAWHNDVCPSWELRDETLVPDRTFLYYVWVDWPHPAERELDGPRWTIDVFDITHSDDAYNGSPHMFKVAVESLDELQATGGIETGEDLALYLRRRVMALVERVDG